jgi:branched-subunit amino acid transport protein
MSWLTLLAMAALVFISRYLLLEPSLPLRLGPRVLHFLHYTSPAVLTAIWAPIVFAPHGQLELNAHNPYLVAAAAATLLAIFTRRVLLTTVASMVLFFILRATL